MVWEGDFLLGFFFLFYQFGRVFLELFPSASNLRKFPSFCDASCWDWDSLLFFGGGMRDDLFVGWGSFTIKSIIYKAPKRCRKIGPNLLCTRTVRMFCCWPRCAFFRRVLRHCHVFLHFSMLFCCMCTVVLCGHCKCIAPVSRRHFRVGMQTSGWGGGVWGMITFLLLAHVLDATARPLLLRAQTCSLLRPFWGWGGGVWEMLPLLEAFRCFRTENKNAPGHKPCHWCDIGQDNGWLRWKSGLEVGNLIRSMSFMRAFTGRSAVVVLLPTFNWIFAVSFMEGVLTMAYIYMYV